MQELEKILEEIEAEFERRIGTQLKIMAGLSDDVYRYGYGKSLEAYQQGKLFVEDIIRKHMNDGWNSVEKYGLPKDEGVYDLTIINGLEEYVSVRWQFLSGTHLSGTQHYVDGVHYWADNYRGDPINEFLSERVIAWRKKPEPYRPERRDNHDGE